MTHPSDVDGRMLDYLLNHTEPAQQHVCGFCRNPWTRYGREDCPNARRDT